jgi:small subunit ribosomal protein S2
VAVVSMKQLLEAGVHFGHRSRRWNPKMRSYIFTERNGIHIIDLQQTIRALDRAYNFVRDAVAEGGTVLFVGTKRQAQEAMQTQAERCGMPYVNERWLGGTLTNFRTIRSRIDYMLELEGQQERGEWSVLPKKEATDKARELAKLQRKIGGLRNLNQMPDAIFVVDIETEDIAVAEANRVEIPVMALVDTNCNPDPVDQVIPGNDDAIRAILLITTKIADAVVEGQQMRGVMMDEEPDSTLQPAGVYESVYGPRATAADSALDDTDDEDDEDILIIDEDEDYDE